MVNPIEAEVPMRSIFREAVGKEGGWCNRLNLVAKGRVRRRRQLSLRDVSNGKSLVVDANTSRQDLGGECDIWPMWNCANHPSASHARRTDGFSDDNNNPDGTTTNSSSSSLHSKTFISE